jgi:DNA mismatch endonuclease (patch repair protein)
MASVPSEGTKPEKRVRRALLELGVRGFECNAYDLPGTPDVILRSAKKAIFVNGCFWHLHPGCSGAWIPTPGRSKPYWAEKLIRNALRDQRVERDLDALGWEVLVIWECETTDPEALRARLEAFLGGPPRWRGGSRSLHAPVARRGYRRRSDSN